MALRWLFRGNDTASVSRKCAAPVVAPPQPSLRAQAERWALMAEKLMDINRDVASTDSVAERHPSSCLCAVVCVVLLLCISVQGSGARAPPSAPF